MITLYIFICYMVMLGMMLEAYGKQVIPTSAWICFIFSPILLPVFIGTFISEKTKDNE